MAIHSNRIPETWLSLLGAEDASGWLSAFMDSSKKAVADLISNAFYFGPLNAVDRGQLLEGWLDFIGNSEGFAERLDLELTSWVEENWGQYSRSANSLVSAWSCLCSVVEFSAGLPPESQMKNCALSLRARFPERERFLGSFSTAPAADPLGLYLAVIAKFQGEDRSLATFWHRMCDLPDGVPFYHAPYAMLGLRWLFAADPLEDGTLRADVVLGLIRLARAFDRLVRTRGLQDNVAESTFHRVAVETAAAYPNSPGWVNHGLDDALDLPPLPRQWLTNAVAPLAAAIHGEKKGKTKAVSSKVLTPDPAWPEIAKKLAAQLGRGERAALLPAKQLLNEQERYAEATGDTYYIVRTLCNFASRSRWLDPALALSWAEKARILDPNNSYTWTTVRTLLLLQDRVNEALTISWISWKRFPEDSVASDGLADVLKVARRFEEAETVYAQTIERFPDAQVPWSGLAEVLKAARRFGEAAAVYLDAIERFPTNIRLLNGLADTLRRMGRRDEAEEQYRRIIDAGYVNAVTFIALAHLLLRKAQPDQVEATELVYRALKVEPSNPYALSLSKELTRTDGSNLDAVLSEWERDADSGFDTVQETAEVESVDEDEILEPVKEELSESSTTDVATPEVKVSEKPTDEARTLQTSPEPVAKDAIEPEKPIAKVDVEARKEPVAPATLETKPEAPATVETKPQAPTIPEIKPEPFVLSESLAVAGLVAESYFYRTWAIDAEAPVAEARRKRAAKILARAEKIAPYDSAVITQKTALSFAEGDKASGYQRLVTEINSHPAAAGLLVLKARLDRERAREEKRHLNPATLSELCTFPHLLRELDSALVPLFHYQRGLAALALLDGDERKKTAADAFSRFRETLAHRANAELKDRQKAYDEQARTSPRFHEWVQDLVNRRVFAQVVNSDGLEVHLNDIPPIEAIWEQHRPVIESVEDVFADRRTFRQM